MYQDLTEISHCEVCGNTHLVPVLDLGDHPMCDDLVEIGDDRKCREFPIQILFCETCLTAHQRFQIPKTLLFPKSYHYRSRHTGDVLAGMAELVQSTEDALGSLEGRRVLDIGCNDGSLLKFFRERGAVCFGIEPTGASEDATVQGLTVINDYLTEAVARDFVAKFGQPDIISFTNVFAHIEDLAQVISSLKVLCHEHTSVVIENHYLGAVIDKVQFDTFYHEHPRTYSLRSFTFIARSLGRKVAKIDFPKRYGGNVRVFLGPTALDEEALAPHLAKESAFPAALAKMPDQIQRWKTRKLAIIQEAIRATGPLVAKAFPGRSAISVKLLGLDEPQIAATYEKSGSAKIGHYIPGTRIPILSDSTMVFPKGRDGIVLNLAWHISGEISAYLRQQGYEGKILNILDADDFAD